MRVNRKEKLNCIKKKKGRNIVYGNQMQRMMMMIRESGKKLINFNSI